MSEDCRIRWFGSTWEAVVNVECEDVPTPIGLKCIGCGKPIVEGDQGILMCYTGPIDTTDEAEMDEAVKILEYVTPLGLQPRRPMHHDCMRRALIVPEEYE